MELMAQFFNLLTQLMSIKLSLFGFDVSIMAIFMYSLIGYFIVKIFTLFFVDD